MANQHPPEHKAWSPAAVPCQAEGAIHRTLGDEAVVLDVDESHYYVLNETGTLIWNLCDGKHTLGDISVALCKEFDVSQDAAQASLSRFMDDLVQVHLLVLSTDGA
jgi:hypothetical protein